MPPRGSSGSRGVSSQRKRKRGKAEGHATDDENEDEKIKSAPHRKTRWFLVVGYPHIGINVKQHKIYSEDALRERCNLNRRRLVDLEKAMANEEIFREVDKPADPCTASSTRTTSDSIVRDPFPGLKRSDRRRQHPSASRVVAEGNSAASSDTQRNEKKDHRASTSAASKAEPRARLRSGKRLADPIQERWFLVKDHPNLGLGLQLGKKYKEETLFGFCNDEAVKSKLRKALSNPSVFEEVTPEGIHGFQQDDVVWLISDGAPWPALVESVQGCRYKVRPFVGQPDTKKAKDNGQLGDAKSVSAKHVHPWHGDAKELTETIFMAEQCHNRKLSSPQPSRKRIKVSCN
eukprot:gnl/MRDRNA2_/MRDRNA2_66918_c0_seq1.p1 gnl/MRDRNA2_/MRDRNA2_66918_c0~~gnl/MRDRNA2_/MRDRNA2_66918_c0_seq1.p1  ORF type:complete len:347 (-),score=64.31 gnl/MRDRNA2_/MRDRNA2_66918_c0_seq1:253-1293(-)